MNPSNFTNNSSMQGSQWLAQVASTQMQIVEIPFVEDSSLFLSPTHAAIINPQGPVADRVEPPEEWLDRPDPAKRPRIKPDPDPVPTESSGGPANRTEIRYSEAITSLTDGILERFPLATPTVLLFVGSERNPHIDETCAQVSYMLARNKIGRVLMVDSNRHGNLSQFSQLANAPGVCDIVNQEINWEPLVVSHGISELDFLPAGQEDFHRWGGADRLRSSVALMKKTYQFICVSAGDAHSDVAKTWSSICDGSYLLVSLKNSNETIAESAVTELRTSGARLLGCVVTDSE